MTRQEIHRALNLRLDEQLQKYGRRKRGGWLTGVHLELFSGCAEHTKALHRLGQPALSFDYLSDPVLGDLLLNPHVQSCILWWLHEGLIASVWLGTPPHRAVSQSIAFHDADSQC